MYKKERFATALITFLLNLNILHYPNLNLYEGYIASYLTFLENTNSVYFFLRILTLILLIFVGDSLVIFAKQLNFKNSLYPGLVLFLFLSTVFIAFTQLTPSLIILVGVIIFYRFFQKTHSKSLSINDYLSKTQDFKDLLIYSRIFKYLSGFSLLLILISHRALIDFEISILVLISTVTSLYISRQFRNMKIFSLSVFLIPLILINSLTYLQATALLAFGFLIQFMYLFEYFEYILHKKINKNFAKILIFLPVFMLILTNISGLSNKWNSKPNNAYFETINFLEDRPKEEGQIIVSNSALITNHKFKKHFSTTIDSIKDKNTLIIFDSTQNDSRSLEYKLMIKDLIPDFVSSDGKIYIYSVSQNQLEALKKSWVFYLDRFVSPDGLVSDFENNISTSEGQAYGMWRSVIMKDKQNFDNIWQFTKKNYQVRTDDNLFAWKARSKEFKIIDYTVASDADIDIAYSLINAYENWGDDSYLNEAKQIIDSIWKKLIFDVNGRLILGFSDDPYEENGLIFNPSYFSPYAYKKFSKYSDFNWNKLVDDTYFLLAEINNKFKLPPNWLAIDLKNNNFKEPRKILNLNKNDYGFDAFRLFFRIALDYNLYKSDNSFQYLRKNKKVLQDIVTANSYLPAILTNNGDTVVSYSSPSTDSALIAVLSLDKNSMKTQNEILFKSYKDGYWGNENNYYDQNWSWFSLALINQKFI
jgi:endoglucanase